MSLKYPEKVKAKDLELMNGYIGGGYRPGWLLINTDHCKRRNLKLWNSVDFIFDIKLNRIAAVYCSEDDPCLPDEDMTRVFEYREQFKIDAAALTLINLGRLEDAVKRELGVKLPDTLAQELFKEVY